jgi:hypothetical protein
MTGSEGDIPAPRHLIDAALGLMARGELPSIPFKHVSAGYGNNERCRLCSQQIETSQVRFRVPSPDEEGLETMTFHIQCYIAWEAAARGV